eukprot:COSAG01_NODE_18581_length_1066_cov_1.263702_2_plen_152_part_00
MSAAAAAAVPSITVAPPNHKIRPIAADLWAVSQQTAARMCSKHRPPSARGSSRASGVEHRWRHSYGASSTTSSAAAHALTQSAESSGVPAASAHNVFCVRGRAPPPERHDDVRRARVVAVAAAAAPGPAAASPQQPGRASQSVQPWSRHCT